MAMKASHWPLMEETSSFVRFTIPSISEDFPRVPTMIAELVLETELEDVMETEAWKRVSWGMFCECERDGCLSNVLGGC